MSFLSTRCRNFLKRMECVNHSNEHTDISADRKYLILISDGSTYLYSKDGNWSSENPFSRSYCPADPYNAVAGGFWDNSIFEPNNHPDVNVTRPQTTSDVTAWQTYFDDVEERNAESNGDVYDYHIVIVTLVLSSFI